MRPEQLLRFSARIRADRSRRRIRFNEAGAAAPVFLSDLEKTLRDMLLLQ